MLKVNNKDTDTTLMMLIMSIVCLLKTLNRCIRLAESLCYLNYVQPYAFQILESVISWVFQVMSVISSLASDNFWKVSGGFRWFQVVPGRSRSFPRFSKHIDVFIKKCRLACAYPRNSVGRGGLAKYCHNCYAKVMGSKGTTCTKYPQIASYNFNLH